MKLEDMVMAVENRKGTETNFLTNMWGFMEMAVKACDDSAIDLADAVECQRIQNRKTLCLNRFRILFLWK